MYGGLLRLLGLVVCRKVNSALLFISSTNQFLESSCLNARIKAEVSSPAPLPVLGGFSCFPIKYSQWVFLSVAPAWARTRAKCQHLKHQQGRRRAARWQAKISVFSASPDALGKLCPGTAKRKVLAHPTRPLGDKFVVLPYGPTKQTALQSARTMSSTGFKAKKLQCQVLGQGQLISPFLNRGLSSVCPLWSPRQGDPSTGTAHSHA